MRRTGLLIYCITLALVATSALAGQALTPHRYLAGSDGPLVQVSNPHDGRTWAAWAYRNGSEFDIAISHVDADGNWYGADNVLGRTLKFVPKEGASFMQLIQPDEELLPK